MSEPRRPPPPKSYVPLNLSTGPPKLPPRPVADAGPPPNYTPPPPPLSDEEEEEEREEMTAWAARITNLQPPPPAPYQPKTQPQPLRGKQQTLPTLQGELHPPPSRPTRPPTANTPSPAPHTLPSSSAPPRIRPHVTTLADSRASSQPPSRAKTVKGGRPAITVVSARPMTGGILPLPTGPPPPPPSRLHPPTSPSPSPTSQSPRVPARKAPTRPLPSKKSPPPSSSSPHQPAKEGQEDGERDTIDSASAPVPPPRKPRADAESREERKKPPLCKSHTLPPRSKDSPPPQRPSAERDAQPITAPVKPTPYRPPAPKPFRPPAKDPVQKKAVVSGRESPSEAPGGGIRIISARRTKPPSPHVKERTKPGTNVTTEARDADLMLQPQAKERTNSGTNVTTEARDADLMLQPQAKQRSNVTTEVGDTDHKLQPQARERTKPGTKEITEAAGADQMLQPQAKGRTKVKVPTKSEIQESTAEDREREGGKEKAAQDRPPPPKPRRSASKEVENPDNSSQLRPQAASASRPQFNKPKPPSHPPAEPSQTNEPPHKPSPSRPDQPSTSQPERGEGKPSRAGPPPPSRPPLKDGSSVAGDKPRVSVEPPKPKRRSQLVTETQSESVDVKQEKSSVHVWTSGKPHEPPVPQAPAPTPRKADESTAGDHVKEESQLPFGTDTEVVKQPVAPQRKSPPRRQPSQSDGEVQREMDKKGEPLQTNSSTTPERQAQKKPGKPPPPRQPSQSGREVDKRAAELPNTEAVPPQRKLTKPSKPPPPVRSPTQPGRQEMGVDEERVVNPPMVKRRNTSEGRNGKGSEEHTKVPPTEKEEQDRESETSSQAVKRQSKRSKPRPPMVIRPAHNQEHSVVSEGKPAVTAESEVGVRNSPKPARPPARPTAQPGKKQVQSEETSVTHVSERSKVPPKPHQPPAPQPPCPATANQQSAQDAVQPKASPDKPTEPSTTRERSGETRSEGSSRRGDAPLDSDLKIEASVEGTEPRKAPHEGTSEPSKEEMTEGITRLPTIAEQTGLDAAETKPDTDADTGNARVSEKTEKERTEFNPEGAPEVVCRRAADTSDIRSRSRPKPSRPMSMPPGRPGKPQKPPLPSTKQNKPPKPAHGPTRPAHGPRPRSRPPPSKTPRFPQASLVDPNVPPALPPRPGPGHLLYKYVCSEPHGIAVASHEPMDPSELAYEADDVIELIERVDDNWFFARNADLEMLEGVIPARDLRIVRKLPGESLVSGFEDGPCAVAMHTFQGQTMDELSFKEGVLIMLKTRVGEEWLRGKLVSGQEGIFPRSFVEIVEDLPADAVEEVVGPTQNQSTVEIHGPHCVALYEFATSSADELSLAIGDTVELLERVGAEWLRGRLRGQVGIFPSQFVEIKEDLPAEATRREDVEGGLSKALFDFNGQEGELSFKAGARVKVLCRVNEEWVEGEMEGKTGMFPASFVDRLPPNLPKQADTSEPTQSKPSGKCEALFDFEAENSGELSFKTGDVILTSEWVNEEWMSGSLGNREGMFPIAFVRILVDLPKPAANKDQKELSHVTKLDDNLMPRAEALQDFTARDSQQLSFKTGDVLNLLERIDNDWFSGENTRTGSFGDFPASSVRVVVPLP